MTKFNMKRFTERQRLIKLAANWLKPYPENIINRALAQQDDIFSNPVTVRLLELLYDKEKHDNACFKEEIGNFLLDGEYIGFHRTCTSNSNSYREVLYDMYLR